MLVVILLTLPRKGTLQEVKRNIPDAFQIVSARLFNSFVGVDGSISSCSCEVLPVFVRNVGAVLSDVGASQTEIKDENLMLIFIQPHAEVIRFYVSMNKLTRVQVLNSRYHLIQQHENSFEREFLRRLGAE